MYPRPNFSSRKHRVLFIQTLLSVYLILVGLTSSFFCSRHMLIYVRYSVLSETKCSEVPRDVSSPSGGHRAGKHAESGCSPRATHHVALPSPKSRSDLWNEPESNYCTLSVEPRWWSRGRVLRDAKNKRSPLGRNKVKRDRRRFYQHYPFLMGPNFPHWELRGDSKEGSSIFK